ISQKTHVPVTEVTVGEAEKLLDMESRLHERVIGQDEAVKAVAAALRRARAELREAKRPIANFLFLGPTGVGKTELAKAVAAGYFGSEEQMIRLDMSEYQEQLSISRLIGAPGDAGGGVLTEAVRKQPFSLLLLDELEKAHKDILNLFLQVMDDGRLTDNTGRTIDFTNVILIATSNAGTPVIQEEIKKGTSVEAIKDKLINETLQNNYRPEFLNRFDGIIVFRPLTPDEILQITWLLIGKIKERLEAKGILLEVEDAAAERLAQEGFDPVFGARPLRRVIQDKVENALANFLLKQTIGRRDVVVFKADGSIEVRKAAAL
ncbi:MAG: AAA family ATPase, partial [bacterium]|nr:AAA family ATPase [bacterium]